MSFALPASVDNVMHSPTHPDWPRLSLSVEGGLKFAANRSVSRKDHQSWRQCCRQHHISYWWSSYICYKPYAEPAKTNGEAPIHRKLFPNNVLLNWEAFKSLLFVYVNLPRGKQAQSSATLMVSNVIVWATVQRFRGPELMVLEISAAEKW